MDIAGVPGRVLLSDEALLPNGLVPVDDSAFLVVGWYCISLQ
jgi:hypothetical protein